MPKKNPEAAAAEPVAVPIVDSHPVEVDDVTPPAKATFSFEFDANKVSRIIYFPIDGLCRIEYKDGSFETK